VADSQKPSKDPQELLPHTDFYLELFANLQGVSAKLSDNHDPFKKRIKKYEKYFQINQLLVR
jgi:hypothetical protein